MTFNLLVTGSPFSSLACHQALRFAKAAIKNGHRIRQVFFYQDAVLIANNLMHTPTNECNIQKEWLEWSEYAGTALEVCIAACIRRGVLSEEEARRHEKPSTGNLQKGYSLAGLGGFTAGCQESDQTLTFGA